jgi:hypothetical protein
MKSNTNTPAYEAAEGGERIKSIAWLVGGQGEGRRREWRDMKDL